MTTNDDISRARPREAAATGAPPVKALTTKQQRFVSFYLGESCGNATDAARRAGYREPRNEGYRLLQQEQIARLVRERLEAEAMAANEVLARLSVHARANIFDVLELDGDGKPSFSLHKAQATGGAATIKSVSLLPDGGLRLELHDAQAALVQLGRYHKLFTDKAEMRGHLQTDNRHAHTRMSQEQWDQVQTAISRIYGDAEDDEAERLESAKF